jgi:hypothetical protein
MAGTTKTYATPGIPTGPADVWINVELPAVGSQLTLDATTLTPDATASPSAVHLGKITADGLGLTWKPSFNGQISDETSAPYRYTLGAEEAMITGRWLQLLDAAILAKMTPGATQSTPSGKVVEDFGGLTSFSTYTVAVIWKMSEDSTKAVVFQLFKAFNESGLAIEGLKRGADSSSPFSFRGQSISTRTAGYQVGTLWKQV